MTFLRNEDIKQGFKHLGTSPKLDQCMKHCLEWTEAQNDEKMKEKYQNIVNVCLDYIREHGEMSDTLFDELVTVC